jgi:hypothetical protein
MCDVTHVTDNHRKSRVSHLGFPHCLVIRRDALDVTLQQAGHSSITCDIIFLVLRGKPSLVLYVIHTAEVTSHLTKRDVTRNARVQKVSRQQ